ncbi:MAG: 23S rRNA (pseudouridine(1915)-N(3))-methyltransferase RlmH [Flavobacteriaceae bacterium]|nr:23S rRNA (pseudouridine(1915)-N(3))-methyltransferase RlmH [Flavobacteriaceae bacterium]MCY4268489.1 23S rRNA (pseudouridine(1915)-N(3))-methyltransferase RlmH [Flavobacteriaceae bacterium]MCY4299011.1 23S rRNA (pseudouridine(1915)-N(3))-methyltransferase RlmH [Flavobacteriaceae bacterium]
MEIHVIAFGKSNDIEMNQLVTRYSKRISRFTKFYFHVMGEKSKRQKIHQLIRKTTKKTFFVSLVDTGQQLDSKEFAHLLQSKRLLSYHQIIFLIGGPYGLLPYLQKESHYHLSFSRMTLTHQMIRVILLEQIYRALTILGNHPYHHG